MKRSAPNRSSRFSSALVQRINPFSLQGTIKIRPHALTYSLTYCCTSWPQSMCLSITARCNVSSFASSLSLSNSPQLGNFSRFRHSLTLLTWGTLSPTSSTLCSSLASWVTALVGLVLFQVDEPKIYFQTAVWKMKLNHYQLALIIFFPFYFYYTFYIKTPLRWLYTVCFLKRIVHIRKASVVTELSKQEASILVYRQIGPPIN